MEEVRQKTTPELAKMLGIKSYDVKRLSTQYIIDNVSPTIKPKVKAAIELYKRSLEKGEPEVIKGAEDVIGIVRPLLIDLDHEECWALMLDSANHLKCKVKISQGTIKESFIDANGVCRNALLEKATAVIIVHNHPSGSPTPGEADLKATLRLKKALALFDIALLDHVIVAKGGDAYSFAEEKVIKRR